MHAVRYLFRAVRVLLDSQEGRAYDRVTARPRMVLCARKPSDAAALGAKPGGGGIRSTSRRATTSLLRIITGCERPVKEDGALTRAGSRCTTANASRAS